MQERASEAQIDAVIAKIVGLGMDVHRSSGTTRTVLGVVGAHKIDPELLKTYDKLGISLTEQKFLAGVAVDAIFDSVSVGTTMKEELAKHGVIFCSFSEAVHEHPELVKN